MPRGTGIILLGCRLILKYASKYYVHAGSFWTSEDKVRIGNLIAAANSFLAFVEQSIGS
jgi:hypothetical protein